MSESFSYKITTKNNITVVTLNGPINKEAKDRLDTCRQEIISVVGKYFILYFKEVPSIDMNIHRELILLQQEIRRKNANLYVVGIPTMMKGFLLEKAIIRLSEIRKSLEEVFDKLKT